MTTPLISPVAQSTLTEAGFAVVRVAAGALLVPHGAQKLFGWFGGGGLAASAGFFEGQLGLSPGLFFAGLAGFIEVFAGLALVAGLLTRPAAFGVLALMAVAAFGVHLPNGFFWTAGGFEYPLFWGLTALALVLHGGGRFSLDRWLKLRF